MATGVSQAEKGSQRRVRKNRAENDASSAANGLRSTVQSLAKGFRILEAFTADREAMTLSEVAEAAGLNPGTTFRMLNTLVDLGYVAKVPDTRTFRLTLKVLDLGFHAIAHKDLRAVVRPELYTLVNDVNEAASFAVLKGAEVLYIERVRAGITRLGVDIRIGTTIPAHESIIGQAILAFLPPDVVEKLASLPQRETLSAQEMIEWSSIEPSLAAIRNDGYALRDSTLSKGLRILAVPVLDPDGRAIGAISIAAPAARIAEDEFRLRALEPAQKAARAVARSLEAGGSVGIDL